MAPAEPPRRFVAIDALRGLAALYVAVFHFYGIATEGGRVRQFIEPFHSFLRHGHVGVQVFFVISGFVIAFSLRKAVVTPAFVGRFLVRRSIRLDPVYWATIALAIAVLALKVYVLNDPKEPLPSVGRVAANAFYLQDILGVGALVGSSWSLCLEVQLYLTFALLSGVGQAWQRFRPAWTLLVVFGPLVIYSLAIRFGLASSPWPGLCFKCWYLFQLGALTSWTLESKTPAAWLFAYLAVLVVGMGFTPSLGDAAAIGTTLFVYGAGRLHRLDTWLGHSVFQYFGRTSYSLYLVHYVLGMAVARFIVNHLGAERLGALDAAGVMAAALAVSLAITHMLHRWVELPTLAWSRRISLSQPPAHGPTVAARRTEEPALLAILPWTVAAKAHFLRR